MTREQVEQHKVDLIASLDKALAEGRRIDWTELTGGGNDPLAAAAAQPKSDGPLTYLIQIGLKADVAK